MSDAEQIRLLIERINDAWRNNPPDAIPAALNECFHERIVMRGPEFQLLAEGREPLIRSYVEFVGQANVLEFTLSEPAIDVEGETAVAACPWQMRYSLGGQEFSEAGHDLFVFARTRGRWLAIWRTMFSRPA